MKRLNGRALGILREALEKDNRGDVGERVVRKLLLQKLQGLAKQEGTPLSESQLKRVNHADYPPFPVAVIQQAAKANNPSQYREATTYRGAEAALEDWQAAIDRLQLIPSQTLAGELAQTHITAANRDLQQARRSLNSN